MSLSSNIRTNHHVQPEPTVLPGRVNPLPAAAVDDPELAAEEPELEGGGSMVAEMAEAGERSFSSGGQAASDIIGLRVANPHGSVIDYLFVIACTMTYRESLKTNFIRSGHSAGPIVDAWAAPSW